MSICKGKSGEVNFNMYYLFCLLPSKRWRRAYSAPSYGLITWTGICRSDSLQWINIMWFDVQAMTNKLLARHGTRTDKEYLPLRSLHCVCWMLFHFGSVLLILVCRFEKEFSLNNDGASPCFTERLPDVFFYSYESISSLLGSLSDIGLIFLVPFLGCFDCCGVPVLGLPTDKI